MTHRVNKRVHLCVLLGSDSRQSYPQATNSTVGVKYVLDSVLR